MEKYLDLSLNLKKTLIAAFFVGVSICSFFNTPIKAAGNNHDLFQDQPDFVPESNLLADNPLDPITPLPGGGVTGDIDCSTLVNEGEIVPDPVKIVCPIARVISFLIIMGGFMLAVVIVLGAIKMMTALGDPKGLRSAAQTWTFGLVGFFIVIGVFALIIMLNSAFGFNIPTSLIELQNTMAYRLATFLEYFGVFTQL